MWQKSYGLLTANHWDEDVIGMLEGIEEDNNGDLYFFGA